MPYATNGGVRTWYVTAGEGPAMVLVHANPFDHRLWLYQTAHFSHFFRVIAVDLRAYGRSDKPETRYSFAEVAGDVLAACRAEGIERAVLCGASIGAKVALWLGLAHPDMFPALVLVGGGAGRGRSYDGRIAGYRDNDVVDYRKAHMAELVAPGFWDSGIGRHLFGMFLENSASLSGAAIARLFESFDDADLVPRLGSLRVPTMVVNGAHDLSLPGAEATTVKAKGVVHEIIQGAGHVCNLEDPAAFNHLVTDFLSANGLMPPEPISRKRTVSPRGRSGG